MTGRGSMNVIEITAAGGPEVLAMAERPMPEPGETEVLIKVAFAGVNRPDVAQRQGIYPPPPGASDLPGLEVSGEVVACGSGVDRFTVGDRVASLVNGGGYAEYCVAEQSCTLSVPEGLGMDEAAALPETLFTVWYNIFMRAGLKAGETLLVHGGTSGIGTTALSLARCLGVRSFATAGSDEKCAVCTELGAELAINYRTEDFVQKVLDHTEGQGADVILDMVGGSYLSRNLQVAAVEGRIAQVAFLEGMNPEIDLMSLVRKRVSLTGSMLRSRSDADKAMIAADVRERAWPLVVDGKLRPVMDQRFAMADAAAAHARMEGGAHVGKIVLEMA